MIFCKQIIHHNLFFFTNQFHFKNWCVVKLFFRNLTRSIFFYSKFSCFIKNALSLRHLKFLIQNMTRCTKNDSKTDFVFKIWSKFFFWMKFFFPQQLFQECTKQPTLTSLRCILTSYIVLWEPVFQKILIF